MTKKYSIGTRVVVNTNFNRSANNKKGIVLDENNNGYVVGFFCEGVETNYMLGDYKKDYPGLKATWWFLSKEVEATTVTGNKFR